MIGGVIVLVFTALLSSIIVGALKRRFPAINDPFLRKLFFYHTALAGVYYIYVLSSPSDSRGYYRSALVTDDWFSLYGTSTTFIKFLNYPFVTYFNFSYEAMMALFSFLGYLGFLFTYIFLTENIRFRHSLFGINLVYLLLLLPNLHFWSGSLGKGSVIFLGISLFFFGISKPANRWLAIFLGGFIIYHVRPHIMLMILLSCVVGFLFSSKGINTVTRLAFLALALVAFFFTYQDVLTMVGIDEDEFLSQGLDMSHRASELTKATSGVDITNYSLPLQVFTFLFRPLFFDAPGFLGIVVSVENVFYLLFTLNLFKISGLKFMLKGNFLVKSAFLSFITVSIALAQISGNLGLAIRQKSQVMILFLFVILMFLDEQKYQQWVAYAKKKAGRKPAEKIAAAS